MICFAVAHCGNNSFAPPSSSRGAGRLVLLVTPRERWSAAQKLLLTVQKVWIVTSSPEQTRPRTARQQWRHQKQINTLQLWRRWFTNSSTWLKKKCNFKFWGEKVTWVGSFKRNNNKKDLGKSSDHQWLDILLKGILAVHQKTCWHLSCTPPSRRNALLHMPFVIPASPSHNWSNSVTAWHGNQGRSDSNTLLHSTKTWLISEIQHLHCHFGFVPEVRGGFWLCKQTPATFRAWRWNDNSWTQTYSSFPNAPHSQCVGTFYTVKQRQAEKYWNLYIPKYSQWQNIYKTGRFTLFTLF